MFRLDDCENHIPHSGQSHGKSFLAEPLRLFLVLEDDLIDDDDDEDDEEDRGDTLNAREAIANELFDDDDGFGNADQQQLNRAQNRGIREPSDDQFAPIDSEHSESDEDNFIVDDNDQPIVAKQRSKRGVGYNDQALQQAQDIFGVDFDFDVFDDNAEFDEEEKKMRESLQIFFSSITDLFELCLIKCRTSSASVRHENTYKNHRTKHCYTLMVTVNH